MPRVLKLSDDKIETLFDAKDFEYLIDKYMGCLLYTSDGSIGLYVEEKNRSWCSSSNANDQRAITIEVAADTK